MLNTILGALLPMVVTFLLGYMAAWRHDFGSKDASTLNRMVKKKTKNKNKLFKN